MAVSLIHVLLLNVSHTSLRQLLKPVHGGVRDVAFTFNPFCTEENSLYLYRGAKGYNLQIKLYFFSEERFV